MRGKDFILTAKMLCKENCREPEWRTSIGRSYYAAYHTIRECLSAHVERALLIRSGGTALYHGFVIRCLKRCSDEKVNEVGDLLNDLRAERRRADYDLCDKVDGARAVDVLSDASDLLIELDSLGSEAIASSVSDLLRRSPYGLQRMNAAVIATNGALRRAQDASPACAQGAVSLPNGAPTARVYEVRAYACPVA